MSVNSISLAEARQTNLTTPTAFQENHQLEIPVISYDFSSRLSST